jgi:hypothetical protein
VVGSAKPGADTTLNVLRLQLAVSFGTVARIVTNHYQGTFVAILGDVLIDTTAFQPPTTGYSQRLRWSDLTYRAKPRLVCGNQYLILRQYWTTSSTLKRLPPRVNCPGVSQPVRHSYASSTRLSTMSYAVRQTSQQILTTCENLALRRSYSEFLSDVSETELGPF